MNYDMAVSANPAMARAIYRKAMVYYTQKNWELVTDLLNEGNRLLTRNSRLLIMNCIITTSVNSILTPPRIMRTSTLPILSRILKMTIW